MPPEEKKPDEKKVESQANDFDSIKKENESLLKMIQALEARMPKQDEKKPEDDLKKKADDERVLKEKNNNDTKRLESALLFSHRSSDWIKQNESLLPKEIKDIFLLAEKEKYENAIEKDSALKSGIIQSFFSLQANVELLTESQKNKLDDYLKLTKNGKQERALDLYENVFEPTFEMLKRIKKAESLKSGNFEQSDAQNNYKKKLIELSEKHYLRKDK